MAFARDPELVWRSVRLAPRAGRAAEPNAAHQALAELQERARVTLITQNVDGLHQRAGSRGVIEFHGSIWTLCCTGWEPPNRTCACRCRCRQLPTPAAR